MMVRPLSWPGSGPGALRVRRGAILDETPFTMPDLQKRGIVQGFPGERRCRTRFGSGKAVHAELGQHAGRVVSEAE